MNRIFSLIGQKMAKNQPDTSHMLGQQLNIEVKPDYAIAMFLFYQTYLISHPFFVIRYYAAISFK